MATNHTANYNLNLWEPNDKFVRDEFNQDNAKIDAALKAEADARAAADTAETNARIAADQDLENRKAAFVKLKEITVTQETNNLNIDVSDIDFGAWQYMFMDFRSSTSGHISLYPNSSGAVMSDSIGFSPNRLIRITLNTWQNADAQIYTSTGVSGKMHQELFKNLNTIRIVQTSDNRTLMPGDTFLLWGLG